MSREIIFRGIRTDTGEWAYGSLLRYRDGASVIIEEKGVRQTRSYAVEPDTVGQYTGITDNYGVKIFEGDIVAFEDAAADSEGYHDNVFINRAVVKYDEYGWAVCGDIATVTMDDLVYKCEFDGEVIGNIHDNPGLLEREEAKA